MDTGAVLKAVKLPELEYDYLVVSGAEFSILSIHAFLPLRVRVWRYLIKRIYNL